MPPRSRRSYLAAAGACLSFAVGGCLSDAADAPASPSPPAEPLELVAVDPADVEPDSVVGVVDFEFGGLVVEAVDELTADAGVEEEREFSLRPPLRLRYDGTVYRPDSVRREWTAYEAALLPAAEPDPDDEPTVVAVEDLPARQRWRARRAVERRELQWLEGPPDFYAPNAYLRDDGRYYRFGMALHGDTAPLTFFVMEPIYPGDVDDEAPVAELHPRSLGRDARRTFRDAVAGDVEESAVTDEVRDAVRTYDYLATRDALYRPVLRE